MTARHLANNVWQQVARNHVDLKLRGCWTCSQTIQGLSHLGQAPYRSCSEPRYARYSTHQFIQINVILPWVYFDSLQTDGRQSEWPPSSKWLEHAELFQLIRSSTKPELSFHLRNYTRQNTCIISRWFTYATYPCQQKKCWHCPLICHLLMHTEKRREIVKQSKGRWRPRNVISQVKIIHTQS